GLRKKVRLDVDSSLQLARPQNFQAVFQLADELELQQLAGIERIALEEIQMAQVHDREFLAEDIRESALGQAPVQRHLAAFKSAHSRITRDGLGALGAAAGKL